MILGRSAARIGVPLFHHYRVVNRSGTHGAFRGSYMRRLHAFLEESDATSLHRRHRRCAQDLAARMSWTSLRDTEDRTADVSPRPKVTRRSVSRARRPHRPVRGAGSFRIMGLVCPHRSEANTVQALMDMVLPRFEGLGDRGLVICIGPGRCRLSNRRRRIRVVSRTDGGRRLHV